MFALITGNAAGADPRPAMSDHAIGKELPMMMMMALMFLHFPPSHLEFVLLLMSVRLGV
jgi:hypothetical protein